MMDWLDKLFGGGQTNAANAMMQQLQQGEGSLQGLVGAGTQGLVGAGTQGLVGSGMQYLAPFMAREPGAYSAYMNFLNQGQNPEALYNQITSSYQMSPQAQAQIKVGQANANNAAAASGMLGSGASEIAAANLAQSVRSEDLDKYVSNVLGLRTQYGQGLQGLQNQGFQSGLSGAQLTGQEAMTGANITGQEAMTGARISGEEAIAQAMARQKYAEDMANASAQEQTGMAGDWSNLIGQGLGFLGGQDSGALGKYGPELTTWLASLF